MWTANLFQVTTGQLGANLHPVSASWGITINENESFDFEFKKSSLPTVGKHWLTPWWAGIVLRWNGIPIVAGPINARPTQNFNNIKVTCGGIRSILAKRLIINELSSWESLEDKDFVNAWTIQWSGLSYGTIAKRVVEKAMQKPGGGLPIRFPVPDQEETDDLQLDIRKRPHTRTYHGFNVQNNYCNDILTELSTTENGPDIMFRPVMFDESHVGWEMWTGLNDKQPQIYQDTVTVWDTTADFGYVPEIELQESGSDQAFRWFGVGGGSGGGTLIRMAQNLSKTAQGYPLLEGTAVQGDSLNPAVIQGHANESLRANDELMHQLNATVRADAANSLGTYWPGEATKLILKDWIGLPDGETDSKILTMSGDLTSNVKLGFKEVETD